MGEVSPEKAVIDYAPTTGKDAPQPVIDYAKPPKALSVNPLRVTLAIVIGVPMLAFGVLSLITGVSVIIELSHRLVRKIYEEDITQAIFCPLMGLFCIFVPMRWFILLRREARHRDDI